MAEASLEIVGIPPLLNLIDDLVDMVELLTSPTEEAHELLEERLRTYPSPPAGSSYERTFRLMNSWQSNVIMLSSGMMGRTRSRGIHYNEYVQDDDHQAAAHVGRWPTVQSVAADSEGEVLDIYEASVQARIRAVP